MLIKCATSNLNGNKHFAQVLSKVSGRLGDRVRDIREWREELRTEVKNNDAFNIKWYGKPRLGESTLA